MCNFHSLLCVISLVSSLRGVYTFPLAPRADSTYPQIEFTSQPLNDSRAIALTFDDGPDSDGVITKGIADVLKSKGVPATFFMNTNNTVDVMASIGAQDAIKHVYENDFIMGSHTVSHVNFSVVSNDVVEEEISRVQTTLATILDEPDFKATLFRAPYGISYEPGTPFASDVTRIAPIAAKYGVHIGWSIDSKDWKCKDDQDAACGVQCIKDNVMTQVKGGSWGIILFHAIYQNTLDALPDVIDELVQEGYRFVSVEDIVKAKYGVESADLIHGK
ncbi:hypothetical protein YB2330_004550 [Saitoella coloradoensis]